MSICTPESYQQSLIELSLENGKLFRHFQRYENSLIHPFKRSVVDEKDTRRSLQYYFVAQDIHERADSAHIDYQKLTRIFEA